MRIEAHKTGARGHRWLASFIEDHPDWLARELDTDYGIDMEAELTENGVCGEILKIQIKSTKDLDRRENGVKAVIERKYVEYAHVCRYPVIFVVVDVITRESWYIWLQEWIHNYRSVHGALDKIQESWTCWIPIEQTLASGLDFSLKAIARWEGETQLVLSLIDALRSAACTYNAEAMSALIKLITVSAPKIADTSVDIIVKEALRLDNGLRATPQGNIIAKQLFDLVRQFGGRISFSTVSEIVLRGESYSRTGLTALGILYDENADHMRSLGLPKIFKERNPEVAYYCAFREAYPEMNSSDLMTNPGDFIFAGLRYIQPDRHWDKYANRGPSALLDYLVPID